MGVVTARIGIAAALWCAGVASLSAASWPPDLERYDWRSTINGSFKTGMVYRARLTPEIFDGFRSFPLDLRVIDRRGVEWPSVVWSRTDRSSITPLRHADITPADQPTVTDFTVRVFQLQPDRDGTIPLHNRVIVNTGAREQARRVEVWGGPSREKLVLLGAGFVVEQKTPAPVRNRSVDYPDARWPVIAVRVYADPRATDQALEWRSTEIARVDRDDSDHEIIPLKRMEAPADEPPAEGVTVFHLDAGARNRPLVAMTFASDATDFALPVRLFGRNEATNKWRWIADSGIHHLEGHEQNRIPLAKADFRYLKLELYHYGQSVPKLKHLAASAIPHFVIFEARSDDKPYLFFGAAQYDLDMANPLRRVDASLFAREQEAELSKRHTNPMRVAGSLSDYRNTLIRFGLGIVALLVALVGIRLIRRRYL
ncbi:MAG TPA: DUF3999 family protein [Kiritimatiellia bacterium]|nr:DUF3999 family protein [Kiritimatiellia bacterium]HMP35682.1 DUF3999 family protein [Kiritimatiellia bacterium]